MDRPNSGQFQYLIKFMLDRPDFAKGMSKYSGTNREAYILWHDLAAELNRRGPPRERSLEAWKRVRVCAISLWYILTLVFHADVERLQSLGSKAGTRKRYEQCVFDRDAAETG